MIRPRTLLLVATAMLGGCAAAMPGYVPPTPQREKMLAAAPKGGGFDSSGATYSLTDQESQLDCKHLTGGLTIKIIQMRDAANRAKPSAAASALQEGVRPLKGGTTYGQSLEVDYKRDRVRLETLNAKLVEKGCKSFDLDAQLKPGNTDVPKPTVDAKKKGA